MRLSDIVSKALISLGDDLRGTQHRFAYASVETLLDAWPAFTQDARASDEMRAPLSSGGFSR